MRMALDQKYPDYWPEIEAYASELDLRINGDAAVTYVKGGDAVVLVDEDALVYGVRTATGVKEYHCKALRLYRAGAEITAGERKLYDMAYTMRGLLNPGPQRFEIDPADAHLARMDAQEAPWQPGDTQGRDKAFYDLLLSIDTKLDTLNHAGKAHG